MPKFGGEDIFTFFEDNVKYYESYRRSCCHNKISALPNPSRVFFQKAMITPILVQAEGGVYPLSMKILAAPYQGQNFNATHLLSNYVQKDSTENVLFLMVKVSIFATKTTII